MRNLIWMRLALLMAICASGLYAFRIHRVSYGSFVSLRTLVPVCFTVALALAVLFSFRLVTVSHKGAAWLAVGSSVILISTAVEMAWGLARFAVLKPGETRELGFADVTLENFTASYGETGNLLESRSNLTLELNGIRESLTVVSGAPEIASGVSVFQLGFGKADDVEGVRPYSRLGFLKERAAWPFMGGLALFDIGALFLLFSVRARVPDETLQSSGRAKEALFARLDAEGKDAQNPEGSI